MTTETEEGGGEELSLRDALSEAVYGDRGDGGTDGATPAPQPEGQSAEPAAPAAPRADGRDEHGRFAPKTPQTQTPAAPEAQAAPTGQAEPIRAPESWSAPAKAAFATLPPIVQQEIAKREADVNRGFEDRASALKRYEPLEQILAPRREMLAARGVSDVQFIQTLFAASDWLDRDPVRAIGELMRQKGVTLQHLGVPMQGGQQPPAQLPPQFQTLAQQVQTLQTQLTQREQAERTQRLQSLQADIQAFANDPANVYFHNVREDMIGLLQTGQATDLKTAYDRAVWANPETRTLLQAETAKKAEAERLNAQRQQTNGARRAAGSVSGAPTPGSGPAAGAASQRSLRDEITENLRASRA